MREASVGSLTSVDWSRLEAPVEGLRGVVVIPARNEAALLPRALEALELAAGRVADIRVADIRVADRRVAHRRVAHRRVADDRGGARFEILVLANNCSDDTAAVARRAAASAMRCPIRVAEVEWVGDEANVGNARGALMDEAARRLRACRAIDGLIFSTDADTCVEPHWFATTLRAFDAGADAVAGRIVTETERDLPRGLLRVQRLDTAYRLMLAALESRLDPDAGDPWPRHHQHFGASLAVRIEAYERVGGLPRVPHLEDMALVDALRAAGCRIRHAPDVRVRTSGRLDGRAEVGLSWQLRRWADDLQAHAMPTVPHPQAEVAQWRRRAQERVTLERMHGDDGADPSPPEPTPIPLDEAVALLRRWLRD